MRRIHYPNYRGPHEPDWQDIKEVSLNFYYLIKFLLAKWLEMIYWDAQDVTYFICEHPLGEEERTPLQWLTIWYYYLWWWGVWKYGSYLVLLISSYYFYITAQFYWGRLREIYTSEEFTIFWKKHGWDILYNIWYYTTCLEFVIFFFFLSVCFRIIYTVPSQRWEGPYKNIFFITRKSKKLRKGARKFREEHDTLPFWRNLKMCPPRDHTIYGWIQVVKSWDEFLYNDWVAKKFDLSDKFYSIIENFFIKIKKFINEDIYSEEFYLKYHKYFILYNIFYNRFIQILYILLTVLVQLKDVLIWFIIHLPKIIQFIYFEIWWKYFAIFAFFFEYLVYIIYYMIILPLCWFFNKDEVFIRETIIELFFWPVLVLWYIILTILIKIIRDKPHEKFFKWLKEKEKYWSWIIWILPWLLNYFKDLIIKIIIHISTKTYPYYMKLAHWRLKTTIILFTCFPVYDFWIIIGITESFITYAYFYYIKQTYEERKIYKSEYSLSVKRIFLILSVYIFFWIRFIIAYYVSSTIVSHIFWEIVSIW